MKFTVGVSVYKQTKTDKTEIYPCEDLYMV